MIPPTQEAALRGLATLCELSPGIRLGQLLAHLGFLGEDMVGRGLGDIEDEDLLRVIQRHEGEMSQRQPSVA